MYTYPTIQSPQKYGNTLFLIKEVFDDPEYSVFEIPYRLNGVVVDGYITKQDLSNKIELGLAQVLCKSSFENGKVFIKIPLTYISNDPRIMEKTESVSNKLF